MLKVSGADHCLGMVGLPLIIQKSPCAQPASGVWIPRHSHTLCVQHNTAHATSQQAAQAACYPSKSEWPHCMMYAI